MSRSDVEATSRSKTSTASFWARSKKYGISKLVAKVGLSESGMVSVVPTRSHRPSRPWYRPAREERVEGAGMASRREGWREEGALAWSVVGWRTVPVGSRKRRANGSERLRTSMLRRLEQERWTVRRASQVSSNMVAHWMGEMKVRKVMDTEKKIGGNKEASKKQRDRNKKEECEG